MTIDITPEAVEHLAHHDDIGGDALRFAPTLRALFAALTASQAETAAELIKLKDPIAVHMGMLRGDIAKPTFAQIEHIYGGRVPSPALAVLAMRERAAVVADKMASSAKLRISGKAPADTDKVWGIFGCAEAVAASIRALPTTFTDAELNAAAMQLPDVRALVMAIGHLVSNMAGFDAEDIWSVQFAKDALAPFRKGGE